MIIIDTKIGQLEVVIEKHGTASQLMFERPSAREFIFDCGKFSCSATYLKPTRVTKVTNKCAKGAKVLATLVLVALLTVGATETVKAVPFWVAVNGPR